MDASPLSPIARLRARDLARQAAGFARVAARHPQAAVAAAQTLGRETVAIVRGCSSLLPDARDRRFADPEWTHNRHYRRWLQGYLALRRAGGQWVDELALDAIGRARLEFALGLLLDGIAPSNFPWQPEAVREFRKTGGRSAVRGLRNFVRGVRENRGLPAQVDKRRFRVGDNLGSTPGAVIARSDVFELIQYQPTTDTVREVPLLFVPPQINKFYVFDLSPDKSVVRKLLAQGHQVFMLSWRNPTEAHRDWGLDAYVAAIEEAVTTVCRVARVSSVNLAGACAGGLTLAVYAAARAAVGDVRANSLTFLVSVLDTAALGLSGLGMFATAESIEAARRGSQLRGFLDGRDMAGTFAWLRPNDLIWNYWVNNVLLGKDPPAFDVLYWNNDTTRLPARLHADFLSIFGGNALAEAGATHALGVPVDLARIRCDCYYIAGVTDHLTPWRACYASARRLGGRTTFVLSNSGHIQCILNPPGNRKAAFQVGAAAGDDPEAWLLSAERRADSWWPHWHEWLGARAGASRPAPRELGSAEHPPAQPAPGSYVLS